MILGLPGSGECFREIDDAVHQLTDKLVVFNAHNFIPPQNTVLYSMENLGSRPDWKLPYTHQGHEIWEFSKTNLPFYRDEKVTLVPVGYHPNMERFSRAENLDIDIAFAGAMNQRRINLLEELKRQGFKVEVVLPGIYGAARDAIFSRTRLAINVHHYTTPSVFEALRVAHLIANKVPVLTERSAPPTGFSHSEEEEWGLTGYSYEELAIVASNWLQRPQSELEHKASNLFDRFRQSPMRIPGNKKENFSL